MTEKFVRFKFALVDLRKENEQSDVERRREEK
jgi:hypothetical protein